MPGWDYPTLHEIGRDVGQEKIVDNVVGPRAGTFLGAIPMKEIEGLSDQVTQMLEYPAVGWRNLGEGLKPSKSGDRDIIFNVKLMSALSEAEALKAEKYPKGIKAYRVKEAKKFLKAMGKEADSGLFSRAVL